MKIQMTQATKDLLVNIGGFITMERGPVSVKVYTSHETPFIASRFKNVQRNEFFLRKQGKGTLITHWLLSSESKSDRHTTSSSAVV